MGWSVVESDILTVLLTNGELEYPVRKSDIYFSANDTEQILVTFNTFYYLKFITYPTGTLPTCLFLNYKDCVSPIADNRDDLLIALNTILHSGSDVKVQKAGVAVGQESTLNFIEGSNVTLTVIDDPTNSKIDITIDASGGGGGTVTDVTGTSPILSSGGTTPDISIPLADALTDGYLSQTDWTIFNSKGNGTVTDVTASGLLTSSGGATPDISSQVNKGQLVGRNSVTAGIMEEISVGSGLLLSGTTLSALGTSAAALTKTDDTNVTLSLGGTPNTSLLQAVSLTLGWTGTLADSRIASASTWNGKQNAITTGTTAQYFRGDLSLATFPSIPSVGTWGALNYPTWTTGTPFVKMTAAGTFALDTNTYLTTISSLDVTTALGYTPVTNARTLTINGTTYDLTADRSWTISTFTTPLTTKGDIYVRNGSVDTRLPVGLDTQILLADSSATTGLKWGTNTAATPLGYYGAFEDNTIQTAVAINTPYAMKFGITDLSNGITIVSDGSNLTRITIANTGIYNIQFSAQFDRTNSGTDAVDIWLRKNGVDVPGSGGKIILTGGAAASAILAAWNYVLDIVAGDYYQLMWSTPDTHVRLLYEAAQTTPFVHPIIPSTILTVTQQSGIMSGTGITAINSLTGAAQTLVAGTSGTDFAVSSVGTTHTLNLPTASASNRGVLSTTDWSAFNSKQDTLTLTTTGTSGAATLIGSTLNVPQYTGTGSSITKGFVIAMATAL